MYGSWGSRCVEVSRGQLGKRCSDIVGGESGVGSSCRCRGVGRGALSVGSTVTEAAAITIWRST